MRSVTLVPCCGKKKDVASPAGELYQSQLFLKMKSRVQGDWGILSAKYGFLSPYEIIEPYDLTLNACSKQYKVDWSQQVFEKVQKEYPEQDRTIIVWSSRTYREYLLPLLQAYYSAVSVPIEGMGIGQQLRYFTR